MSYHLIDATRNHYHCEACGEEDGSWILHDEFAKLPAEQKCQRCSEEWSKADQYMRTCRICGQKFTDRAKTAEHERKHTLEVVSYRKEPMAFVVRTRDHYDRSDAKARTLSAARAELREFFSEYQFEIVPSRMMLSRDGGNSVLIGEAHVVDYLIVQK